MRGHQSRRNWAGRSLRSIFRFDAPLLVFLLAGWSLIFATATLGLQRDSQRWLPVSLAPHVFADYGVDARDAPKLAHVDPEIIEAAKQDARLEQPTLQRPHDVTVPEDTPTPALDPTPTPTPPLGALTVGAGGPYSGEEGDRISLVAGGFNSALNILPETVTYLWDLDDDGLYNDARGIAASVVYYDEGEYPVTIQATDLIGRVATGTTTVTVSNAPPTVDLGPDQLANEAEEIEFLAQASDPGDDILFYEWDFGDGSRIVYDTSRPKHTYQDDGLYRVIVRVNDNDDGITEDSLVVFVENLPPTVEAGPDQVSNEGSFVTFSGAATDPADDQDTLTYAWDLDFDGKIFSPDILGATATTVYPDGPANMVAALLVQDEDGGKSIDTVAVTVNNVAPVLVGVTHDDLVDEGSPLNLVVEATDVGSDTLTFDYDWQNDGAFDAVKQPATVSNIWRNDGFYEVDIRVDDGDGGQDFITTTITILNAPPIAVAQGPDTAKFEGEAVALNGSDSSDPGIDDTLTYEWDFGDGSPTANQADVTHVYAENGVYSATLTVADDSGDFATGSVAVAIVNANPMAKIVNDGPDRTVEEGVQVSFAGQATDPGSLDVLSYAWDFDYDGISFSEDATGVSVIRTFPDGPREHRVALRVRDDDYPYPTGSGGQIGEDIDTLTVIVANVPPKNVDAHGPYEAIEGQIVTLTGTAEDVPADPLSFEWDFNYDGDTFEVDATGQTVTNTWSVHSLYTIRLRVIDNDGGENFDEALADINAVPNAAAGGPYSGLEGAAITFNGSGSSDPDNDSLTYNWIFGDGSTANGIIVTHAYADNGVYTAALTLSDDDGAVDTDFTAVTIQNVNPIANAGPDRIANEGVQINLVGTAMDPGAADVLTYTWDFAYDGIFDEDATGTSVNVTYPDGPATYTVALRVDDDDGGIGFDTALVTVNNVPPIAVANGPYSGVEGQPVTLTGAAGDVPADTHIYQWDLDNDGTFETPGQTVVNTWNTGGAYPVEMRVTDDDGGVGFNAALVDIDFMPIASAGGPYTGNEGSPITLSGSGSDPDGDPLTYTWDLDNDGVFETPGQVVSNTWTDNGLYPVALQVDDGQGGTATANATVIVNNLPPTANAGGPYNGDEGLLIAFDGSGSSDPGANDTLTYQWNFGDGSPFVSGSNVTHAYADNGLYTVTLTVTDDDGDAGTDSTGVTIQNVNPTADAGGPYNGDEGSSIILDGSGSSDPGVNDILTYEWDFDYDGLIFDVDANGVITGTSYPDGPATYTVALRVNDGDGGIALDTAVVTVNNLPPAANAGPDQTVLQGEIVTFNGTATDPGADSLTYEWDFDYNGFTFNLDATGQNITHTWTTTGAYTVALQVSDDDGAVNIDTVTVTVNSLLPFAWLGTPYVLLLRKKVACLRKKKVRKNNQASHR